MVSNTLVAVQSVVIAYLFKQTPLPLEHKDADI